MAVVRQTEAHENGLARLDDIGARRRRTPQAATCADLFAAREKQILQHGKVSENAGDLESAHEAAPDARGRRQMCHRFARELYRTGIAAQGARQKPDEARLAGTVRADDGAPLANRELERDIVRHHEITEALDERTGAQDRGIAHRASPFVRQRRSRSWPRPIMPPRANMTISTSMMPMTNIQWYGFHVAAACCTIM